jgi:transcription elongation factor SPT5
MPVAGAPIRMKLPQLGPWCVMLFWKYPLHCSVPNRAEEEYEYAFDDEPTPSPQAYGGTPNPQTPGYPDPSSPQVNPQYNPQTPGTPAM